MSSLIHDLEQFGAGIFVTARGIDSRLAESDLWRAFEEPVVIWVHGQACDDATLDQLLKLVRKIPQISRFRFTGCRVTQNSAQRIYEIWPNALIEGVAT